VVTIKHRLRVVLAIALGVTTMGLVALLDRLPYSEMRVGLSDALEMPGAVVGFLVASGGVHGEAPMLWYWSFMLGNLGLYSLFWWLVLFGIARNRSRGAHANDDAV
jgi:hypothetical protein